MPVAGGRERAVALEQLPRERVVPRRRLLVEDVADVGGVRRLGELAVHALADQGPRVLAVEAEVVDERQVVDAGVQRRGALERRVDELGELALDVVHAVAEADDVEPGLLVDGLHVGGHRVGVVEEERVGRELGDVVGDLDEHRGRAQQP